MEKFNNFTIIFCWKVINIEYIVTIVKQEVFGSGTNQKSSNSIIKRVFNQINVDNFEEFTLEFVSDLKNLTYKNYMNQLMELLQRKMLRRFFEPGGNYKYRWLPDCILYPNLDCISRFRAPFSAGLKSHYIE